MRRVLLVALLTLSFAAVGGSSASAINDPVAPGDNCSASTSAIGHPGGQPATDMVETQGGDNPVDGVASRNNPGNAQTENDTSANADDVPATSLCVNG